MRSAGIKAHNLSPRAPGDLNRSWKAVRDSKSGKFVEQGRINYFPVTLGGNENFATAEYFGCTVFVIVTSKGITVGHLTGERGARCPLATDKATSDLLLVEMEEKIDRKQFSSDYSTTYAIVTGPVANDESTGVPVFLNFFADFSIPTSNIRYIRYRHTTALSEFRDPHDEINPVQGRSLFHWGYSKEASGYTWRIYLGNETPRLELFFNEDGSSLNSGESVRWADSPDTSRPA